MQRTYSSQLPALPPELTADLDTACALYGQVSRHYFVERYHRGVVVKDIKRAFLVRFGINARWFNAIRSEVDAKVSAAQESRKLHRDALIASLAKQQAKLVALKKQKANATTPSSKRFRAQKIVLTPGQWREKLTKAEGRLLRLTTQLSRLEHDIASDRPPRMCFGSRKLFAAQHRLHDNGFDHAVQWRNTWQAARNNQLFLMGSKGETAGNQNVQAIPVWPDVKTSGIQETNRQETPGFTQGFQLFLTLPRTVRGTAPLQVCLGQVRFAPKAATALLHALRHNIALSWRLVREVDTSRTGRVKKVEQDPHNKQNKQNQPPRSQTATATTWRLHFTTELPASPQISLTSAGAIGLDFNADHVAACRIDASGNPVEARRFPLVTVGCTADQIANQVGEVVKEIVAWAVAEKLPLVGERLDFAQKKKALGRDASPAGKRVARMLSGLAYASFFTTLASRCFDAGIAFHPVNPAYSSVIGQSNYARKYGLSTHQAAACVIARRHLSFTERPHRQQHANGTWERPVMDRHRPVWTYWRSVLTASKRRPSRERSPGVARSTTASAGSSCTPPRAGTPRVSTPSRLARPCRAACHSVTGRSSDR